MLRILSNGTVFIIRHQNLNSNPNFVSDFPSQQLQWSYHHASIFLYAITVTLLWVGLIFPFVTFYLLFSPLLPSAFLFRFFASSPLNFLHLLTTFAPSSLSPYSSYFSSSLILFFQSPSLFLFLPHFLSFSLRYNSAVMKVACKRCDSYRHIFQVHYLIKWVTPCGWIILAGCHWKNLCVRVCNYRKWVRWQHDHLYMFSCTELSETVRTKLVSPRNGVQASLNVPD